MFKIIFQLIAQVSGFHHSQYRSFHLPFDVKSSRLPLYPNQCSFSSWSCVASIMAKSGFLSILQVGCFHCVQTRFSLLLKVGYFHYGQNFVHFDRRGTLLLLQLNLFSFNYQKQTASIMTNNQFVSVQDVGCFHYDQNRHFSNTRSMSSPLWSKLSLF